MFRFFLFFLPALLWAGPQKGQIVVDPNHPNRMAYHDTYNGDGTLKSCFFAGPGDPEDLFYNNTDANVAFLISKGARCTYITAVLKDFGGGDPGTGSALDSKLNEWETIITKLENAGIVVNFFFFDDAGAWRSDWESFTDKIVAKFKHHKLLIWSVAEEYSEGRTKSQISNVAARIKAQDDRDHVVAVHQLTSTSFDFNGDDNLDMFEMQIKDNTPSAVHNSTLAAWNNLNGKKILNVSEIKDHGRKDRTSVRQWNWAGAMGGGSAVQVLWMGRASDDAAWNEDGKYTDAGRLTDFMEATDLNAMSPNDALASGGTDWVLADPGAGYIAYAVNLSGGLGVQSMTAGTYQLSWLDIVSGSKKTETKTVPSGTNSFSKPSGFGSEIALYISGGASTGAGEVAAITVSPDTAHILKDSSHQFSAQAKDKDGKTTNETINWSVSSGGTIGSGLFQSSGMAGTFLVTAKAGSNSGISGTAVVKVYDVFPAPVAVDGTTETDRNKPVLYSLEFLTVSPGPFGFLVVEQPGHGQVEFTGNDITYTPDSDYTGTDSFKWQVVDSSSNKISNEGTVTITIKGGTTLFSGGSMVEKGLQIKTVFIGNNNLYINFGRPLLKPAAFKIFNIQGQIVLSGRIDKRGAELVQFPLPLKKLNSGYYLFIVPNFGQPLIKKFLVIQ